MGKKSFLKEIRMTLACFLVASLNFLGRPSEVYAKDNFRSLERTEVKNFFVNDEERKFNEVINASKKFSSVCNQVHHFSELARFKYEIEENLNQKINFNVNENNKTFNFEVITQKQTNIPYGIIGKFQAGAETGVKNPILEKQAEEIRKKNEEQKKSTNTQLSTIITWVLIGLAISIGFTTFYYRESFFQLLKRILPNLFKVKNKLTAEQEDLFLDYQDVIDFLSTAGETGKQKYKQLLSICNTLKVILFRLEDNEKMIKALEFVDPEIIELLLKKNRLAIRDIGLIIRNLCKK